MKTNQVPTEWDLKTDRRYKMANMEKAMLGKVERGLVELITNSDDSYRTLTEEGKQVSGKIRIEIERKRKESSVVIVRDRAGGLSREEMYENLGALGKRTSGFESGKARRGLHGRGAKDVACFGTVHFESIKDNKYSHLVIPHSLHCHFIEQSRNITIDQIRAKLGLPRGNGTIVTIEVDNRFNIPQHEKLCENFARYYSLRDIFSSHDREVIVFDVNAERESLLRYTYPTGETVYAGDINIDDYPDAKVHLTLKQHSDSFPQEPLPLKEGILIKSAASIHDCTHFGLETEPFALRFIGIVQCDFIDTLIREYEDREERNPDHPNHPSSNPIRILDPFRDGLVQEHPFTRALHSKCKAILKEFVGQLKASEEPKRVNVTNANLEQKLRKLSKELSSVFEKQLRDLDEEVILGILDGTSIKKLGLGLHIIPSNPSNAIPMTVNEYKTFSVIIKHYESLDTALPVDIIASTEEIELKASQIFLKTLSDNGKVGRSTFAVRGSNVGSQDAIEVRYNGYSNIVLVKVVEQLPPPVLPDGLSFDRSSYSLKINKEKALLLWLKSKMSDRERLAEVISSHSDIVVKGGGRVQLMKSGEEGILVGRCKVLGRQLKAKGTITARVEGFEPAKIRIHVEDAEPPSGVNLDFEPVEETFGYLRYKWDDNNPYLLKIAAKHPSVARYLGERTENGYTDLDSALYHTVLAEIASEALSFKLLEKLFKKEGEQGKLDSDTADYYYHYYLSTFSPIAHKILVPDETI